MFTPEDSVIGYQRKTRDLYGYIDLLQELLQ